VSRVAVLSRIMGSNPDAMAALDQAGLEVALDLAGYEALGGDEAAWLRVLATVTGLVVGLQPLPAETFAAAANLRYVLRIGTGMDNIDVEAAGARGVVVESLPGLNAPAVAEYAFGLMLAAARRIPEADRSMRAGEFTRFPGRHLGGRTLGLIGYGEIARLMVPKARGFDMDVIAYRRSPAPNGDGVRQVGLDALLTQSDFISVHVPLTEQTRSLIGRREFGLMRDGVVLVNTARGAVMDEQELYHALVSGKVAACGLDVFASEPPGDSPLLTLPNVVASPHNGGYSDVITNLTALTAARRLIAGVGVGADAGEAVTTTPDTRAFPAR
jgi:D-3-phosphoglycerate dehydrogenase / 2-oxoglutarate reductase